MAYDRMRKLSNGCYVGRHSCFLLQYHLVLITKYHNPVITDEVEIYLKNYTLNYFKERYSPIVSIETMPDHMHVLFETVPTTRLDVFVNAFKAASSRVIRQKFKDELKQWYYKPVFWSQTYFIGSVSERSLEIVKHYIDTQKEKSNN